MAKSLILVKFNLETFPTNAEDTRKLIGPMLSLTQKDLQSGALQDWGYYAGGGGAYAISNQTPEEITKAALQMQPYVSFEVHPVLSLAEMGKLMSP